MMRRNLLPLLLALGMALGLAAPARCAGEPALICDTGDRAGIVSLSLEELDGSAVYGVQVELLLAGEYPGCAFLPADRSVYSPGCTAEVIRGSTLVTVYLTGRASLTRGGALEVGELDLGIPGMAGRDILPETAQVILLDERLRPGAQSGEIPVTATAPAGTDHTLPPQPGDEPQLPSAGDGSPLLPFADVRPGDWFYDAARYVHARGIMSGTSPSAFSPNGTTTRGMVVTMLHRLEGSPAALPVSFTDVPAGQYYAVPVAWASAGGIVTGTAPGRFSPDTPVTREQLAAILYRFAQYKGLDASGRGDLSRFPDAPQVSPYAADAMSWAVDAGLITGSDGRLEPGGSAVRAQVAAIFQRLCEKVLELP